MYLIQFFSQWRSCISGEVVSVAKLYPKCTFLFKGNRMKTRRSNKNKNRITRKQKGGAISILEWPLVIRECDTYSNNVSTADECYRKLKAAAENPYYLSDKVSGYTNNGFFNDWGYKTTPKNVKYITVKNSGEISEAIKYCIVNNKKLIVKNTGHDYIGRSYPSDNSVVVWTHKMDNITWKSKKFIIDKDGQKKQIDFSSEYKKNCRNTINYEKGYATVEAGVQWWKVFDYMNKNKNTNKENRIDVWAMKGASNTVGAAGGWLLDGGFSSFTKLFGMGVDNILSMEVVLADGSIHHISNCNEPDLFFAFRGGGACNFGIVSNVTYRLLDALSSFGDFFINIHVQNEEMFKNVFILLLKSNLLLKKNLAGTIQIFNNKIQLFLNYANIPQEDLKNDLVIPFINELNQIGIPIRFIENTNINLYTGDLFFGKPFDAILSSQPNSTLHNKNKKFTESHGRWWEYESFNDFIVGFGSRYLLYSDIKEPVKCADIFWNMLQHANMIQLETSKGLYGADENIMSINKTSAVNPLVREAIGLVYIRSYLKDFMPTVNQPYKELLKVTFKYENHALLFNDWSEKINSIKDNDEKQRTTEMKAYILSKAKLSSDRLKKAVNILRQSIGNNATYINHSDVNEPDWGNTFWGEDNFNKLIKLKKKYDPTDMFHHKYSIPLELQ